MLKIYGYNDRRFTHPIGMAEAESCVIDHEINGNYGLTAEINASSSAAAVLVANNIIVADGEPFRIFKTEKTDTTIKVAANHLFFDLKKAVKVTLEEQISTTVQEFCEDLFSEGNTSVIGYLSSSAIESLGLTPLDQLDTDTEALNHKSFYDCLSYIIDNVSQGEIYISGNSCAVVEEVKTDDVVRTLRIDREIEDIKITEDTTDIVTRAYVFGKDGLDLTATGRAHPYIVSPNADIYGVKSGVFDYSSVSDERMLLARANWLFDADNQNRVDVPYVTVECSYRDLKALGNTVEDIYVGNHYTIELDGIQYERRVVKITKDLVQPENTKITLGRVEKDLFYYFKRFNGAINDYLSSSKSLTANTTMYNQIIEIAFQESIAADTANLNAVFSDDIFTESLETNLLGYLLIPNLTLDNNQNPQWGGSYTWSFRAGTTHPAIRNFIKLYENKQQFIEQHLTIESTYTGSSYDGTTAGLRPLQVNGRQVYWSGILGANEPYKYLTFVDPTAKLPNITAENKAMFMVYLPPLTDSYIKGEFSWNYNQTFQTYEPRLTFGTGDTSGNGKYYFEKDSDSGKFVYKSRTDNGKLNGIQLKDDGTYLTKSNFETEIPPMVLVTDLDDVPSDAPIGTVIGLYTDTSGGGS